ncbi:MAG: phospho-N-acetylmuramoyl-pentapeptide-transferase [Bacteroidota bacterium]
MLYYFFEWLDKLYEIPGFGVFRFISFRSILAIIFSLIISLLIGKKIIDILRKNLIGEVVRDTKFGPDHAAKAGTPTMGGLIIIAATIIPTLLWGDIMNGYVWLILLGTMWMGTIGFVDDYIKVFKKDKKGLKGKFKVIGQVGLGLIVGLVMLFHPDFGGSRSHITQLNVIRYNNSQTDKLVQRMGFVAGDRLIQINGQAISEFPDAEQYEAISSYLVERENGETVAPVAIEIPEELRQKTASAIFGLRDPAFIYTTDFPFFKEYVFDYSKVLFISDWIGEEGERWLGKLIYLLVVIFIITAVSNAVNLTDGIDGLAAGTTAIVGAGLGVFAYVSGNAIFSSYLNITYIPLSSELLIFIASMVGGCLGFLWYNSFPAQVFMGDTGSLALGGAVGILALMVKKELLIPIFCGIFLAETLSVMIQVSYFKYTKRKTGEGKRIFLMSPLHHHYEKKGIPEAKIVMRFFIVAILLVAVAFATLKLR